MEGAGELRQRLEGTTTLLHIEEVGIGRVLSQTHRVSCQRAFAKQGRGGEGAVLVITLGIDLGLNLDVVDPEERFKAPKMKELAVTVSWTRPMISGWTQLVSRTI